MLYTGYIPQRHLQRTREHFQIEANIDDMTAEAFEPLMDTLFAAGAADVFLTPIVMKKSRAAHCLTVLCPAAHKDLIVEKILNQSSTIGLRVFTFAKHVPAQRIFVHQHLLRANQRQDCHPALTDAGAGRVSTTTS